MTSHITDLARDIADSFAAGYAARLYVGQEPLQYQVAADRAKDILLDEYDDDISVIDWNRLCGFHVGEPDTVPPKDKSNMPELAWNLMIKSVPGIAAATAGGSLPKVDLPFNPLQDIIFVIHEADAIFAEKGGNGPLVTLVRSFINANMASPQFDDDGQCVRGKRMLVFLATHGDLSKYLPELQPATVALPDAHATENAIDNVFGPLARQHDDDPNVGLAALTDDQRQAIINACQGMPYRDREDAISKALTQCRGSIGEDRMLHDIETLVTHIEDEKARFIRGIPGVQYVPKSSVPADSLPGYEVVDEFIDHAVHVSPEKAKAHGLPSMRGILLIGPPGVGKSEAAKCVARRTNRMLLLGSLGEIQGGLVGQTEANMRRFLDVVRAMKPVVLIDEIDKQGTNTIQSGQSGDGGTFSRAIGMLLTEMADPSNEAIWILTANNLVSADGRTLLPPPLIRRGRIDERYFVDVPDQPVREAILRVHANKHHVSFTNADAQSRIGECTEHWVGAELADLVIRATRHAIRNDTDVLDTDWMYDFAGQCVPMCLQDAFRHEVDVNRKACEQFTIVGRTQPTNRGNELKLPDKPTRNQRKLSVG